MKRILKSILPVPFLKQAFLVYNKLKIASIDKWLFPEWKVPKEQFRLYREGYPFKENSVTTSGIRDEGVRSLLKYWDSWTQEEYILCARIPQLIEPDHGWAMVEMRYLNYYSLGISRAPHQPKPDWRKLKSAKPSIQLEEAISLRDTGEENYFHFFNDVLSKIYFLNNNGIQVDRYPVVISKKLWDKPYFQYYLARSPYFKKLNWIVQDTAYILCKEAIFCKPLTHRIDLFSKLLEPYPSNMASNRLLFITRSKSRLRFLENQDEIEEVCRRYGVEVVDNDKLGPAEQVETFSSAGVIIGIHGAGLTNMIFRQGNCRILEIFPPAEERYLPFHYIMLASMKGFSYDAIQGAPGSSRYSGGFRLPADIFEARLRQLLQNK